MLAAACPTPVGAMASAEPSSSAPSKARGCTDLPWLFALAALLGVAVFVASFALALGDPRRLVHGYDSFGNVCGARNAPIGSLALSGIDARNRPYLFHLDVADPHNSLKICISQCPSRALRTMDEVRHFGEETGTSLCRYDVTANSHTALSNSTVLDLFNEEQQRTGLGPCPRLPVLPTKPVRNRCVPYDASSDILRSVYGYLNSADTLQQVVSDLFAAWREVCCMLSFACVLSFAVVFLLHRFAAVAAKAMLILSVLSVIAAAATLWWTYVDIKVHLDMTPFDRLLEESAKNERAFLVFAIAVTLLATVLLALVLALHKQAGLALFHEAGHCIRLMPFLLVQPLWTLVALVALFSAWTVVFLHLATANHASRETLPIAAFAPVAEVRHLTLVTYEKPSWVHFAWWFQLLFLLWAAEFVLACQQAVIAGVIASWYFCKDRTTLVWPVGRSAARLFIYHLGSVALGSLLTPLCRLPRVAVVALRHWTSGRPSGRYRRGLWCFNCEIHNAYTIVTIRGTSLCAAGRTAYSVLFESSHVITVLGGSGGLPLFLAQCLVTSVVGLLAVVLLRGNPHLQLCAVPVLAVTVFSYFVAHCVLSLYGTVVDTLVLCFSEDVLSWEPSHRDLYAPESLRRLLLGDTALLRPLPAQA
uniref:Choline transporter-like protein n=1 Tax=Rhipicephalus appendiculatus TaxID=34631 RepID=A0A131YNU4_RHIAP